MPARLYAMTSDFAAAKSPDEVSAALVRTFVTLLGARTGSFAAGASIESLAEGLPEQTTTEVVHRISLPFALQGRSIGVATFEFDAPRTFDADLRALIAGATTQAALAYDRAVLFAAEHSARSRLAAIAELTEALARATTRREVAEIIVERGKRVAGADLCTIHMPAERDGVLTLVAAAGVSREVIDQIATITNASENPALRTLETGEPIWAETEADFARLYPALATLASEGPRAHAFWSVPLRSEDRAIGLLGMGFYVARPFPDDERAFAMTFARQCAEALRSTERIESERAAQTRRAFIERASSALVESLDYEATIAHVARLAVPVLADWCAVEVLDEGATIPRQIAVAHVDPKKVELARTYAARYPADPNAATGVPAVIRSGKSEIYPDITDQMVVLGARDAEHLALVRELHLRSIVIAPLSARGRVIGAISFVHAESGRRYTQDDLAFAEDLARRCAIAIDNAHLYAAELRARREAVFSSRAKDQFLATMSHELRSPLSSVMGWANLLNTGTPDAALVARGLAVIHRNAAAMARLIEDLLDLSRIASGKIRLDIRPSDLARVVESAIDAIRADAERKNITLAVSIGKDASPFRGDASRVEQVVRNLLSNAMKFTADGGRIDVTLKRVGDHAEIAVADNGKGIEPAFLPRVFEPFQQAEGATMASGGLGLGLSIARQLVEHHSGTIGATSEGLGHGAKFTVRLPLTKTQTTLTANAPAPTPVDGALIGVSILAVDDDDDARAFVKTILELSGARVATASGALEAIAAFDRLVPDLLLSDIGMPGRDGYTLLADVRARPADRGGNVPAVALTAFAYAEDRARAICAGFAAHVSKPVDAGELVALLARVLRESRP